jgi:hypothetical protein
MITKEASEARANRAASLQRLIDKSADLTGKVTLITGVRRGRGRVITVAMRPQEAPKMAHL